MRKRILCVMLVAIMFLTTCLQIDFGLVNAASAGTTENTEITALTILNDSFMFTLASNDYGSAASDTSARTFTDYNYWSNVEIYLDGESAPKTLEYANKDESSSNPQKGNTFYNLWTRPNTFAVGSATGIISNAVKVVIPSGTEFPSYEYTSGKTTTKKSYVTTEKVIFIKNGSAWEKYEEPTTETTEVTALTILNDCFMFTLSTNDYGSAASDTSASTFLNYNYWENIQIYLDGETTPKTLADANKDATTSNPQKGNTFYNLWTRPNTFAVGSAIGIIEKAVKVTIPAGTEFPSYAYTKGNISAKKSYVTAENITYVKNGTNWEKMTVSEGDISDMTATPSGGETVNLLSGGIYQFVTNYEKGSSESLCTKGDCYAPIGVTISWDAIENAVSYTVKLSTKADMSGAVSYPATSTSIIVNDLYAGEAYYYQIVVNFAGTTAESQVFDFKTAELPRTILIDGVSNTRDLGGWKTTDGKYRVRQGLVYRGAAADDITEEGKVQFLSTYGIKTDLDVRGEKKKSPLGDDVNFVNVRGPMYMQITEVDFQAALAEEIRTFADIDNYPIYFHCQVGRDRTGTLAFLINALLGVSEEDLYMDYELSMFSEAAWRDNTPVDTLVNYHFVSVVEYIKSYGDGTLAENTENFMKNELGITQAEIDAIRALLLEEAGDVETEDSSVSNIHVRNGKLLVFLTNHDYDNASATTRFGEKISEYNMLDKVVLYKSDTEYATLREVYTGEGYYNVWGETGSAAFTLKAGWDGTTIKKVVFLAGCNFPAYSYTNDNAEAKTNYVLRQQTEFATNTSSASNTDWTEKDISKPKEIEVSKIQSGHNGTIVTFHLSNSDYSGLATEKIGDKHTDYNYWEQIRIYSDDTNYITLAEAYKDQKYYNMWTWENTISISLTDTVYANATRIVIPEGTVFPSYKYTSGATNKKYGYMVTEELIFERPQDAVEGKVYDWVCVDTSVPKDVAVTKVLSGHNEQIVSFYLSDSDYESKTIGAAHTDYNYLDMIRIYSDETIYKTLGEVHENQKYYNMWGREDTISLQLTKEAYDSAIKIVIPEGTVFPAYVHTNEGSSYKHGYKTTSEITFTKPIGVTEGGEGYEWISSIPAVERETVVKNLQLRDATGKLILFLAEHDYTEAGSTNPVGNKLQECNILQNIVLYKSDTEYKTLAEIYGNEQYYNIWGETGSIAIDLADGWDGTNVQKVVIKAGCEFPSYEYTSGSTTVKTVYKTKYEIVFTATEQTLNNASYVQSIIIPSNPTETEVVDVQVMGATNDMRLIVFLSVHDYDVNLDSIACSARFKDYNTLANIFLCLGDKQVALADAINEDEVYFNLWGKTGSISYGLKPEYTVDSFEKVIVKSGCEFPSYIYATTDSLDKVAYTTTTEKEIALSPTMYKVSYYDANKNLLYTDEIVCGTPLTLRLTPAKEGYKGIWNGMNYTLMPAKNIAYYLSYEKIEDTADEELQDKADDDNKEEQQNQEKSPDTGDLNDKAVFITVVLMVIAVTIITIITRKKYYINTK